MPRKRIKERIKGHEERENDVYVSLLPKTSRITQSVVYFPDAMQDFEEFMESNEEYKLLLNYSFEKTMLRLEEKFPDANIWIIKPSKRIGKVALYKNFVEYSDEFVGRMVHNLTYNGLDHMYRLIYVYYGRSMIRLHPKSVILIGLGDGCAPLTQFLDEAQDQLSPLNFERMYYLNGGNHENGETLYPRSCQVIGKCATIIEKIIVYVNEYHQSNPQKLINRNYFVEFIRQVFQCYFEDILPMKDELSPLQNHLNILEFVELEVDTIQYARQGPENRINEYRSIYWKD